MTPADIDTASEDVHAQISRLRRQVEELINERVSPALAGAAERAEHAARAAADTAKDQAEVLSGQVRERPILSLVIAAGIGFVLGRTLR